MSPSKSYAAGSASDEPSDVRSHGIPNRHVGAVDVSVDEHARTAAAAQLNLAQPTGLADIDRELDVDVHPWVRRAREIDALAGVGELGPETLAAFVRILRRFTWGAT